MKIQIDVPATKATPDMVAIMSKICTDISPENLRKVHAKLEKLGAEQLNKSLSRGLSLI